MAVAEREFRAVLVDIAQRRDADRVRQRRRRHPHARGQIEMRFDDDFGALQIADDAWRGDARQTRHLIGERDRGLAEQFGVGSGECDRQIAPAAAAIVRPERDARIGDLRELRRERAFEIVAGLRLLFLEDRGDAAIADARALIGRFDVGLPLQQRRDMIDHGLRLRERCARDHFDRRGRGVAVLIGLERHRERACHHHGQRERAHPADHRRPAVQQRPAQHRHIDVHDRPLAVRAMPLRLQEIGGDHRRDEARDGQTHQHRDHDGQAEVLEELPRQTRHQPDRQEHRDDRHGGGEHREADFVGSIDRSLVRRFPHPHVPHDIFDLDDRIVDQHAGHQAQGEQTDPVEREAHQIHEPERRDRRKRDRQRRNDGRAPVAQEDEHDDHREHRALDHRVDRRMILQLGIFDLVEDQLEMHLGVALLKRCELGLRTVEHADVGPALGALEVEA